jgi:hypothetical protein
VSSVRVPLVCYEWLLGVESWCERHNCFTGGWDGTKLLWSRGVRFVDVKRGLGRAGRRVVRGRC